MKLALAILFYAAAFTFIYAGFSMPGAEGLGHHIQPRGDAELTAAMLIFTGCAAKLFGHVMLFASARS